MIRAAAVIGVGLFCAASNSVVSKPQDDSTPARSELAEGRAGAKLFSLASRAAGWDATETFLLARERIRRRVLSEAYMDRHIRPLYSEDAARAHAEAHEDELKGFLYHRNEIVAKLKQQAEADAARSLMSRWGGRLRPGLDVLDLARAGDATVLAEIAGGTITVRDVFDTNSGLCHI
jgi:hypothetical protein